MALEGVGLGLALLSELSKFIKSIQERNACYREAPVLFRQIDGTLVRLNDFAEKLGEILRNNPQALPQAVLPDFISTLETVKDSLLQANNSATEYCSQAFFGTSSSNVVHEFANKGKRFFKAKSLAALMSNIQRETSEAENMLQHLFTHLGLAVKSDDLKYVIEQHVQRKELFQPAFNAPRLPGNVRLDFESRNTDGELAAPEAELKSQVFISTSAKHLTVARGACLMPGQPPVHGVSGMAGVGKTVALIGLGHDIDIKTHFSHGVLFMKVGATATVGQVTGELSKIMRVTGATTSAAEVQSSKSLGDAVSIAAIWFHGKRILFLIDDIWPTTTSPEGYLPELEGLLQGSPDSRIVLSTRSLRVAANGGSHVDFGARDPYGPISVSIFMAHAAPTMHPSECETDSARGILKLCAGLPIVLSVAGAAVGLRVNSGVGFEYASRMYLKELSDEMELHPGAKVLETAIRLSLSALAADWEKRAGGTNEAMEFSVSEVYTSLCVMGSQQFAPVPVLSRMWNVSETKAETICTMFTSMSLAKISTQIQDGREQCGLLIHDLHLDYCRKNSTRDGTEQVWHRRLLDGHIIFDDSLNEAGAIEDVVGQLGVNMLEYTPRPWWRGDVKNNEYIRTHLSRHLRCAGLHLELGAAMMDFRWIISQSEFGGVLGLKNDFDILERVVEENFKLAVSGDPLIQSEPAPVKLISKTILTYSSAFGQGGRALSHFILSDLFRLSQTDVWIGRFLGAMMDCLPKPCLEAKVSFYLPPGDDEIFRIDLKPPVQIEYAYFCTDFSACDEYSCAGADHDVLIFNLKTMNRLAWLKGHEKSITVVKFSSDVSKVISGSLDKQVIIWEWQKAETPSVTLRGHKGPVSALSFSSDESQIFSGSEDGTVKMWNLITGVLCREFVYGAPVDCLAGHQNREIVAVGTRDGCLRCINWRSGDCLLEYTLPNTEAVSAVQFGSDGKSLISGNALGEATSWRTSDWTKIACVTIPGSVTNIAFHPDGSNAILGSSEGEVRHWDVMEKRLSAYNIATARPVNGLSFRNNGKDIIVGLRTGYARAFSGPHTNPSLDFEAYRKSLLFDFRLSVDGTRVVTSTHDSMIRVWNTRTGSETVAYSAPDGGSRRLALSTNGSKIASSSESGVVRVWQTEMSPGDGDIKFEVDNNNIKCLSFSPDGSTLLVCCTSEVQVWRLESKQKVGHVPSLGFFETSFSSDGRFIIVGNSTRTLISDATSRDIVFDTSVRTPQTISSLEARNVIKVCGPAAYRMWPSSFMNSRPGLSSSECASNATKITVDNFSEFIIYNYRPDFILFCEDVLVMTHKGVLVLFRLRQ